MMPSLALHHFTIGDVDPLELVSIAASCSCDAVCVFVSSPADPAPGQAMPELAFPAVTPDLLPAMKTRLRDEGVTVTNIEFFPLGADTRLEDLRPSLALGAELGARLAVTHIYDSDTSRAADTLARFGQLAAEYDLCLGLEFMGLSPTCNSLEKAAQLVRAAAQDNIGIAVDALHLMRTGGTPEQVKALDPALFAYAQLCDGPTLDDPASALDQERYLAEAFDRLAPGKGVFPLMDLVNALPSNTFFDVEVPSPTLAAQGVAPTERARLAVEASRRLLAMARARQSS